MSKWAFIDTFFGILSVEYYKDTILSTKWVLSNKNPCRTTHPVVLSLKKEINKYSLKPNYKINCKTNIVGTTFQKNVWKNLCDIPSGTTLSYGELATIMKSSPRAIGQACKRNPLPLIVPCHRVISKNNIGGFMGTNAGRAIDIKLSLLNHETVFI